VISYGFTAKKHTIKIYDYSQNGVYLATVGARIARPQTDCTPLSNVGMMINYAITKIQGKFPSISVGKYVNIDNHNH
jgi:hypothetical protein